MRKFIRNLCLSFLLSLSLLPFLQSQSIAVVQYRYVSGENIEEFLHRETTYWSEVARAAIKEGKMVHWALWQKVGGWNLSSGSNFMFVNVFEKPEHLNHTGEVWNLAKVFPNRRFSEIETNSLSTLNHQLFFQTVANAGSGEQANFIRINYAKASELSKYLELEQSVWQPFIKAQIESGKTTQVSWLTAALLMPSGAGLPFNAVTVDGYSSLGEAIVPGTSFSETPEWPDLTAINKVHKKDRIQVYRLVKAVNSNE